jgi:uncharacterized membrane protein YfcA
MDSSESSVEAMLARPLEQRAREHKYRCAQALVFGVPVVALHLFGHQLGGPPEESRRWSALLQALLAGWVTYVSGAGMLVEGIMLIGRRVTLDFVVAAVVTLVYLVSLTSALGVFFTGQPFYSPLLFHLVVMTLAGWCGLRWWQLSRSK